MACVNVLPANRCYAANVSKYTHVLDLLHLRSCRYLYISWRRRRSQRANEDSRLREWAITIHIYILHAAITARVSRLPISTSAATAAAAVFTLEFANWNSSWESDHRTIFLTPPNMNAHRCLERIVDGKCAEPIILPMMIGWYFFQIGSFPSCRICN